MKHRTWLKFVKEKAAPARTEGGMSNPGESHGTTDVMIPGGRESATPASQNL